MSEESEEEVPVLKLGGGAVRAAKSSELGEGKLSTLKWTHLEQVQHCTDLPRQVTFPAHTE